MRVAIDRQRLAAATASAVGELLNRRNAAGHWTGRLSTSALSTATAVMALEQLRLAAIRQSSWSAELPDSTELQALISRGRDWLLQHQQADGGWGDTPLSFSNISTTLLARATLHLLNQDGICTASLQRAATYIDAQGGVPAMVARYGKDRTFSVPILTHCALAGLVDWRDVPQLPFELACIPMSFYAALRLPVVSYALPALIAIGQVRHHFHKSWNPFLNWLREAGTPRSLRILRRIQPENGGFLEATPLTSFVSMSLIAKGLHLHPVVEKGIRFICQSVLPDGSWPIDTNLATWVTTLSVNALGEDLPEADRPPLRAWLTKQQYREFHPYTGAAPGGWAWTDLPGGVPDADDTPGAILALQQLKAAEFDPFYAQRFGVRWLLNLQNGDGGWPTFCRGWTNLPFDRSSCDITAHAIRAIIAACPQPELLLAQGLGADDRSRFVPPAEKSETPWPWIEAIAAIRRGMGFLAKQQRVDGAWLPLWFGNQHTVGEENPTYGTVKVLAAYRDLQRLEALPARDGIRWLRQAQNPDGGWGAGAGTPSSVEETALALEVLLEDPESSDGVSRGLQWLIDRVASGAWTQPAPIGFYFAKLWYYEELYPLIFTVAALRKARQVLG